MAGDSIPLAATKLALRFTDASEIPQRFKGGSERVRGGKSRDSMVERRFRARIQGWGRTLENLLNALGEERGWRLIRLAPVIEREATRLVDCQDFIALHDFLVHRRDVCDCDPDELGTLATLLTAVQGEIERALPTPSSRT
jgi:hypothetical protein